MGKLIVLEGLDGSGKGTQTGLLKEYLEQTGHKVRVIDFPDYKSEGSVLVRMYLDGKLGERPTDTNAYTASMFFAADRYVSFVTDWRDAFEDSETVVIANRYTTANAYHQLSKMDEAEWDAFLDWLWDFEFEKLGLPAPDRVILLDMPESVSSAMVVKRSRETGQKLDIHEKSEDYLERCRTAAAYTANKCGWRVVKCANEGDTAPFSREQIAKMVQENISDLI